MGTTGKLALGAGLFALGAFALVRWGGAGGEALGPKAPEGRRNERATIERGWEEEAERSERGEPTEVSAAFEETPGSLPSPAPWLGPARAEFVLQGLLVDPYGRPVSNAEVLIGVRGQRSHRATLSDGDGRFEIRLTAASSTLDVLLFAHELQDRSSCVRSYRLLAGEVHSVYIDLARSWEPSHFVEGSPWLRGEEEWVRFQDGGGVSLGLPDFEYYDYEVSSSTSDSVFEYAEPPPPRAALSGSVLDEHGNPVARAPVGAMRDGVGPGHWTYADKKGDWELANLDPGRYALRAGGGDFGTAEGELVLAAGVVRTWEAWLDPGRVVRGRLVDPEVGALGQFVVHAEQGSTWSHTTESDGEGRFAIPNAPGGPLRLLVYEKQGWPGIPVETEEVRFADGLECEVRIPREQRATAWVSLVLTDADGSPTPAETQIRLHHLPSDHCVVLARFEPGLYASYPVPPGAYRMEACAPTLGWLDLGAVTLTPGQRLELGSFAWPRPGVLQVECAPEQLEYARHWQIVRVGPVVDSLAWEDWPLDVWEWVEEEAPPWVRVQLPAGEYCLVTAGSSTGRVHFPFVIESEATTHLRPALERFEELALRFDRGPLAEHLSSLRVRVLEAGSGAEVLLTNLDRAQDVWPVRLAPGSYRAVVEGPEAVLAEQLFGVGSPEPASQLIRLP